MPTISAVMDDGRSGMTRSANSPAARSWAISASSSCERRDERVVLLNRVRRRRVLVDERAERQPREQLVTALARGAAVLQRFEIDVERHIAPDGHELTAAKRLVSMRQQRLAILLLWQLGGLLQQRVEAAVGADQIDRALLADAWHAGHVVARIADEREHVDHLRRADAEFLGDRRRVEPGAVVARVVDADAVVRPAGRSPCRSTRSPPRTRFRPRASPACRSRRRPRSPAP